MTEILKIFVPVLFSLPRELNHEAPFLIIVGATAIVSTFVTVVGHPESCSSWKWWF